MGDTFHLQTTPSFHCHAAHSPAFRSLRRASRSPPDSTNRDNDPLQTTPPPQSRSHNPGEHPGVELCWKTDLTCFLQALGHQVLLLGLPAARRVPVVGLAPLDVPHSPAWMVIGRQDRALSGGSGICLETAAFSFQRPHSNPTVGLLYLFFLHGSNNFTPFRNQRRK